MLVWWRYNELVLDLIAIGILVLVMHYIERSCLDGAISYSRSLHAIGPLDIGDRGVGQNILLLAGWLRLSHRKARYCMSKDLYLIFYWPLGWIIYVTAFLCAVLLTLAGIGQIFYSKVKQCISDAQMQYSSHYWLVLSNTAIYLNVTLIKESKLFGPHRNVTQILVHTSLYLLFVK
jgi:hypothetical protein